MEYITLKGGDKISRIGLGTSRLTPDKEGADTVLKAADSGINLINCADFYNSGDGELAVRGALRQRSRDSFFISVKFGALMTLDHPGMTGIDVAPEHVENYLGIYTSPTRYGLCRPLSAWSHQPAYTRRGNARSNRAAAKERIHKAHRPDSGRRGHATASS